MMEETGLSRKERERLFRQKEIIDASIELFAKKGYSATTLDEIAEAAEFGKGTLYNYFSGKQEIYKAIIKEVLETDLDLIKKADETSSNAEEFVTHYTHGVVKYCVENKYSFLIFVREMAHLDTDYTEIEINDILEDHKEVKKIFLNRIKKSIKSNEIKNFNPEKVVSLYTHMVFPYIHHLIICQNGDVQIEEEVDLILKVLFQGILKK